VSDVVKLPLPKRDCYACFDFERAGNRRCVVCGRPVGKRLPEEERPPAEAKWWLDGIA
jgi:hypothetical protein